MLMRLDATPSQAESQAGRIHTPTDMPVNCFMEIVHNMAMSCSPLGSKRNGLCWHGYLRLVPFRRVCWVRRARGVTIADKCQILDGKSDEEKLHSMLNEVFWGGDVDEESGLVYGPFKHAFKCIAKYVSAAWRIRNAYARPSDVA